MSDLTAQITVTGDPEPLNNFAYSIKPAIGAMARLQEPTVGSWYCHFETKTCTGNPDDESQGWYECDGNLGQYIGEGEFVDEDGEPVEMTSDFTSSWNDYLVMQH